MADYIPEDQVYSPPVERILSYLDQLERHGPKDMSLPSAISSKQMYSSGNIEIPDHRKEVWMGDFADGASGKRDAKWYATELIYPRKGNNKIRKTPGGGSWNSRTRKDVDAKKCKDSLLKRMLNYRIGEQRTPWRMEEYTLAKDKPKFAICKIFRENPREKPSEGTAAGAQYDQTTMGFGEAAALNDGLSPNQVGINYAVRPTEPFTGAVFDAPSNFQQSIQSDDVLSSHPDQLNGTLIMETLDVIRSMPIFSPMIMDNILWQQTPIEIYHGPSPNQYINPEEAWNGGNVTSDLDQSLLPPQDDFERYADMANMSTMLGPPNVTHQIDLGNSHSNAILQFSFPESMVAWKSSWNDNIQSNNPSLPEVVQESLLSGAIQSNNPSQPVAGWETP